MGLYYNNPSPHIGAAQPVAPPELTPPSGPVASNPIFGAASLAATLVAAWAAAASPLPQTAPQLILPPVAAINPTPSLAAQAVLDTWWWQPPYQPQVTEQLVPPISGPISQNAPVNGGAQVSKAALVAWLPPPPLPLSAVNLDPPISGPTAQNPPFPGGFDISWQDSPDLPVFPPKLAPLIAGPVSQYLPLGTRVPIAVHVSWLPAASQPPVAINLDPPIAGPTPQNPPFVGGGKIPWPADSGWPIISGAGVAPLIPPPSAFVPPGARVSVAVEVWWLPPPPQPPSAINLDPPRSGLAPQAPPVRTAGALGPIYISWLPPPPPLLSYPYTIISGPPTPTTILVADVHERLRYGPPGGPGRPIRYN